MTGFPRRVRDLVTERANGACERCGMAAPAYQLHHRRPRGMGGSSREDTNTPANALLVCVGCHSDIEANRDDAYKYGWLVHQSHDPVAVKVLRRGEWVRLANNGWMH